VIVLLYLSTRIASKVRHHFARRAGFTQQARIRSTHDLQEDIQDSAVKRIRPKMLTAMVILVGLLPIMSNPPASTKGGLVQSPVRSR
jgi:Cu/Ag efflux pump CusA